MTSIAVDKTAIANKYITPLLAVALTTTLHIKETISTAETIVVGTYFLTNPIPTAIIPMLAATRNMANVVSIACNIIENVKSSLTM